MQPSSHPRTKSPLMAETETMPLPQSILPMAILERPSLEDASASKDRINLKVEQVDTEDASKKVAFRENLSRAAARRRLGIASGNSSQLNISRISARGGKSKDMPPRPKWNSSQRI